MSEITSRTASALPAASLLRQQWRCHNKVEALTGQPYYPFSGIQIRNCVGDATANLDKIRTVYQDGITALVVYEIYTARGRRLRCSAFLSKGVGK